VEIRRLNKSKSGQKTNCAAARSREGGFTGDETSHSKSRTTSAQMLRESFSCVEQFSSGKRYSGGANDRQVGGDSADFKGGGGGPGSEAHGQINDFDELCGNGDENAGDAEHFADWGIV
jgi:hypothetical protein